MGYRRGFKTEAESIAGEVRKELGLQTLDRLDPLLLAAHLDIPVLTLSELRGVSPGAAHLLDVEPQAFSAVTVFSGRRRTIVHNDAHAPGRQSSNVGHELSHALLLHPPAPALDDGGCRLWDQGIEDEAQFLAGALLIPRDACIAMVFRNATTAQVAAEFGVSERMAEYRLNISGARTIAARARRRRNL
jgi:hypothetical protein